MFYAKVLWYFILFTLIYSYFSEMSKNEKIRFLRGVSTSKSQNKFI